MTQGDGSIARDAADDKTPLDFHLERYDAAAQMAFSGCACRGSRAVSTPTRFISTRHQNAASADSGATYDKTRRSCITSARPPVPADATAYKSEPSIFRPSQPGALIGSGTRFNGTTRSPSQPPARCSAAWTGWTFSAWVRVEQPQAQAM